MMLPDAGFTIIPGPFEAAALDRAVMAFDRAVATAPASDRRAGSTSLRISGVLDRAPELAHIISHGSLLEAAAMLIGGPFKLSAFHVRNIMPGADAQALHQDVRPGANGWPLLGFIFMVDAFEPRNGATRFVPGSAGLAAMPADSRSIALDVALGPRGSLLLYDGSVWHGHGANSTTRWRRSIQGAFVPKSATANSCHRSSMHAAIWSGLSDEVRQLIAP